MNAGSPSAPPFPADAPPSWATAKLSDGRLAYRVAAGRGVPSAVFAARLRAGWSVERAVYEPKPRLRALSKPRPSLVREVRLSDGRLAWPVAAAAGMSEATFRERLRRGLSPDRAALDPVRSAAEAGRLAAGVPRRRSSALMRLCLPDGRPALAVAAAAGVSAHLLRLRLARGWPLDRAASEPVRSPAECVAAMAAARAAKDAPQKPPSGHPDPSG